MTRLISEQHQYAKFHIVTRCNNSTDCINVGNREKPKTRNVLKLGRNIKDFFCKTLRHTNKGCAIKIYLLTYLINKQSETVRNCKQLSKLTLSYILHACVNLTLPSILGGLSTPARGCELRHQTTMKWFISARK